MDSPNHPNQTTRDRLLNRWYRLSHRAFTLFWRIVQPTTIGVKLIVTDTNDRILLVKPRYQPAWTLPGGGVHKRETPEDAAVREIAEETGLHIDPETFQLRGILSSFGEGKSDYVALYGIQIGSPAAPHPGSELEAAAFFAPGTLPANTSAATRRRIDEEIHGLTPRSHW